MFTSRAEFRLLLREDNADLRLTPVGRELGLVDDERWRVFETKREQIARETRRLSEVLVRPADLDADSATAFGGPLRREQRALELLKRPEVSHAGLTTIPVVGPRPRDVGESEELAGQIDAQVEIQARYDGYLLRQEQEIERARRHAATGLPADFDYTAVRGLSHEARQKLAQIRPATLAQAARISGVTPAAISLLLVHLKKKRIRNA